MDHFDQQGVIKWIEIIRAQEITGYSFFGRLRREPDLSETPRNLGQHTLSTWPWEAGTAYEKKKIGHHPSRGVRIAFAKISKCFSRVAALIGNDMSLTPACKPPPEPPQVVRAVLVDVGKTDIAVDEGTVEPDRDP